MAAKNKPNQVKRELASAKRKVKSVLGDTSKNFDLLHQVDLRRLGKGAGLKSGGK